MAAAATAGGENESMGGIDLVNSRRWCETNCIKAWPEARSDMKRDRGEKEAEKGVLMMMMMNEGGGLKCQQIH